MLLACLRSLSASFRLRRFFRSPGTSAVSSRTTSRRSWSAAVRRRWQGRMGPRQRRSCLRARPLLRGLAFLSSSRTSASPRARQSGFSVHRDSRRSDARQDRLCRSLALPPDLARREARAGSRRLIASRHKSFEALFRTCGEGLFHAGISATGIRRVRPQSLSCQGKSEIPTEWMLVANSDAIVKH